VEKPVLAVALIALLLAGGADGATPAHVEPDEAPAGATVTITGEPGPVTLEPLGGEPGLAPVVVTIPEGGSVEVRVPEVAAGTSYRVLVAGAGEAPVLTVTEKLDGETSALLLGFGFLLVLGLAVGGIVIHRRWRDAIS
jgi:hypothetical protein